MRRRIEQVRDVLAVALEVRIRVRALAVAAPVRQHEPVPLGERKLVGPRPVAVAAAVDEDDRVALTDDVNGEVRHPATARLRPAPEGPAPDPPPAGRR